MIFKVEIQKIAAEKGLGMDIVEEDYILSWVLAGIHHHAATENFLKQNGTFSFGIKYPHFQHLRYS